MRNIGLIFIMSLFFFSCSGADYTPTVKGDMAEINTTNKTIEAELLFVTDSSLFVMTPRNTIEEISINKLKDIEINGYVNKDWIFTLLIGQTLPSVIIGVVGAAFGNAGALIIPAFLALPTLLNFLLFSSAESDPPGCEGPLINKNALKKLRKYSRFPQGLTTEQFIEFSKDKKVILLEGG